MRFIISVAGSLFLTLLFSIQAMAADSAALLEVLHNKGVIDDASYADIKGAGKGQAADKKLLDVLHTKGILDDATYTRLSEQADAEERASRIAPYARIGEPPVATAPQATPATAAPSDGSRPFEKAFSSVEEGFAKLGGDTVKLKIGAFVQAGWLNDDAGFSVPSPPTTGLSYTSGNQFFVRRARLFFDGQLTDKAGFKVSVEASDTNGKVLRDAFAYIDYMPYNRVTVGQFKTPFGVETVEALGINPAINRSLVSNFIAYPTLRDLGVMLTGKYQTKAAGLPLGAGYSVGLFNGSGMNASDDNDRKDVVGRAWVNPLVEGLTLGGSASTGKTHAGANNEQDHDRWGADIDYTPALIKGLKLRGEFMWERKYFKSYASKNIVTTPGDTFNRINHTYGWYALVSYRVEGLGGPLKYINGLEPVARYDLLDEDTSTRTAISRQNSRNRFTAGINYYLNKYTRLMADYEIIHADGSLRKNSLETIDLIGHHLFTTLVQVKF